MGKNLGRAELDFKNSKFNFMKASIFIDFTKKFPVIKYFAPHFFIKIAPDSLISGICTFKSDNLLFGKAKLAYSFKGNNLKIEKLTDIFLKPNGIKIDKEEEFSFTFDFKNLVFRIQDKNMKGFIFLDKKHKLIGELDLFFDWMKGKLRFRLGNLLKVNLDLKEVDFNKAIKKSNLNIHDLLNYKSSTKYCSFNISAQIDKMIFPNEQMTDVKFFIFCVESNIRSLLFVSKLDESNLYIAMNAEKQIWIKGDSVTKLIKLFLSKEEFKDGELGIIVTLLNPNIHTPIFSYEAEICDFEIKKIWLLEMRNIFSPIRTMRRLFDSASRTNCKLKGFFDQHKFSNQIEISNNYNKIMTNSVFDFDKQVLDLKTSLIYKNLFTYASEKLLLNNLADKIEANVCIDFSKLDFSKLDLSKSKIDMKMELKKISVTPGVVLGSVLQSFMF